MVGAAFVWARKQEAGGWGHQGRCQGQGTQVQAGGSQVSGGVLCGLVTSKDIQGSWRLHLGLQAAQGLHGTESQEPRPESPAWRCS